MHGGFMISAAMYGNGAMTFMESIIIVPPLSKIPEVQTKEKTRFSVAARGDSALRASAQAIVTMKIPDMRTSASDMTFMAFAVYERVLTGHRIWLLLKVGSERDIRLGGKRVLLRSGSLAERPS